MGSVLGRLRGGLIDDRGGLGRMGYCALLMLQSRVHRYGGL